MTTELTSNPNNARRVVVLYNLLVDSINDGSIVGIAMWSDELLDCMAHIEVDNRHLFLKA